MLYDIEHGQCNSSGSGSDIEHGQCNSSSSGSDIEHGQCNSRSGRGDVDVVNLISDDDDFIPGVGLSKRSIWFSEKDSDGNLINAKPTTDELNFFRDHRRQFYSSEHGFYSSEDGNLINARGGDSRKLSTSTSDSGKLSTSTSEKKDVEEEKDKGDVDEVYLISDDDDDDDDDINNNIPGVGLSNISLSNISHLGINNSSHVSHFSLLARNKIVENYESESLTNLFNICISESSDDEGEDDPVSSLVIWRIPKRERSDGCGDNDNDLKRQNCSS